MELQNLNFPLDFNFNISTFSNDFTATDVKGNDVAYVRSKIFKIKEDVVVYSNDTKTRELFTVKANHWIEFNAAYSINDTVNQKYYGSLVRKGLRSIWKARYEILDENKEVKYYISEDHAVVRFLDSMVGEIPILNLFTGYIFNPSYTVTNTNNKKYFSLNKMPSLFGKKFKLNKMVDLDKKEETLIVISLMMMVLLERTRG